MLGRSARSSASRLPVALTQLPVSGWFLRQSFSCTLRLILVFMVKLSRHSDVLQWGLPSERGQSAWIFVLKRCFQAKTFCSSVTRVIFCSIFFGELPSSSQPVHTPSLILGHKPGEEPPRLHRVAAFPEQEPPQLLHIYHWR